MSSRAALFLIAASVFAQDAPARFPIIPIALFTASHAATGSNEVSPGAQVQFRLIGLAPPIDDLREAARILIELQLKDSPIVYAATVLPDTASQTEVRGVLPEDLPLGEVHVYLLVDGQRKMTTTIRVVPTAPGIYTEVGAFGPVLAHQYDERGASLNGLTHPATPGQFVTLWATGLGVDPQQAIVELAGRPITPEFAGRNPIIPGLDQINFRVPAENTPLGCYIPVAIHIGDRRSPIAALAIGGNAGACPHPLPLDYSELVALEEGREIDMAWFEVASGAEDPNDRREVTRLDFGRIDKRAAFIFGGLQATDEQIYSCPVQYEDHSVGYTPFYPDAGPPPIFAGPDGRQILLTSSAYASRLRPPDGPFSSPGQWLLSVLGGADIAPFQQTFRVPPPVLGVEIQHSNNTTTITWDPSGYVSGDVMKVTHYPEIVCRTPAWSGQITLPGIFTTQGPLSLEVEPHLASRPRFRIPRTDGTSMPAIGTYLYNEPLRRQ